MVNRKDGPVALFLTVTLSPSPRSETSDQWQWQWRPPEARTTRCSPREEDFGDEEEEEQCRICRLPAGPGRPLRRPCACRGSIRFVHDDCQLRWIATRGKPRCEVCNRGISTRLLYARDAPVRLPISEFLVGLPDKLTGLLLPLIFAVCVVPEFTIHLATLWSWRLALARSFDQAHYLLSLRLSTASVLGLFALWVAFAHEYVPFAVAPFSHWVARLEARRQGFGGFDGLQILALFDVEAFLVVVIFDLALACVLGFLPFSLGRIALWCILCSYSCNVGEVNSYTSTASVLLIGYGFIISVGVVYAGLNIVVQYLRGKRLVIATSIRSLSDIFLTGVTCFTSVVNFCLNTLHGIITYPLFFGWSLDICTSKMFGATMSRRLELLFASSFASTTLHCFIGFTFLHLHAIFSRLFYKARSCHPPFNYNIDIDEPFYKFYFNKRHRLLHGILYMAAVIFVPVQIADCLAPELFPLDITCPAESLSFWQAPRDVGDSLSRVLLLRLLIEETYILNYPVWLVKKVTRYSFATNVVLAWLAAVLFYSAVLIFPISIGRALFAITRQARGLKSNDLLALVVGFGVIITTIDASRDAFAYMTKEETHLRSLSQSLIVFLWVNNLTCGGLLRIFSLFYAMAKELCVFCCQSAIVPFLIGSLVGLLLIPSPAVPDDDVSIFYTWFLGFLFLRIWVNLDHQTRDTPFLAYFIDERWSPKIVWFDAACCSGKMTLRCFIRELFMPIATKLLPALCIPYVLAKGVFPGLGYSAATNSAVYRFAWLGSLGPCGSLDYSYHRDYDQAKHQVQWDPGGPQWSRLGVKPSFKEGGMSRE